MNRRRFIQLLGSAALLSAAAVAWLKTPLWSKLRNALGRNAASTEADAASDAPATETAEPQGEKPLMAFMLLSDLHINSGVSYPSEHLKKALHEITHTFAGQVDALLLGGDVTEAATEKDYKELRSVLSKYKLPPIHANMGNHDYYHVWIDDEGGWNKDAFPNGKTDEQAKANFCQFFGLEKPYHDIRVNGYHVILLSQEIYQETRADVGEGAWYSDEQLNWLKEKLAENKDGKPVFVLIHQPLPPQGQDGGSHRVIPAKRFRELLKPYKNVFVFSGHTHQDFENGSVHYVKESFHWFHNSAIGRVLDQKYQYVKKDAAQGLYVQVYADRVVLRGREFSTGQWLPRAEWNIAL